MGEDWQDGKSLSECNLHMLTHEIACDVTFLVGEREDVVMAHTYVLESRAAKLCRLFADQKKFTSKLVLLPEVHPEPFRQMLRYLYAGHIDISTQQALSLIPVVHRYGPHSLAKRCFEQILAEMTSDSACDVLEKCHKYGETDYHEQCLNFINVNAKSVLKSRGFEHLCRECVESIVSSDELHADETDVFHALVSWADSQCSKEKLPPTDSNRREKLGNLIFHVRFSLMSITEFTEKVSIRNILTSDEKIKIFQHHHGGTKKLPPHFIVTPRKTYQEMHDYTLINNGTETNITSQFVITPRKALNARTDNAPTDIFGETNLKTQSIVDPKQIYKDRPERIMPNSPTKAKSPTYNNSNSLKDNNLKDNFNSLVVKRNGERHQRDVRHFAQQPMSLKVNRFQTINGVWKNNGPDAISFKCSCPILLHGIQVFSSFKGTNGFNLEVAIFNSYGSLLCKETSSVVCRDGYRLCEILLTDPVRVPEKEVFTIRTHSKGSPVHCGKDGVTPVIVDDVKFDFIASNKSLNGTDVMIGQIPILLFTKL